VSGKCIAPLILIKKVDDRETCSTTLMTGSFRGLKKEGVTGEARGTCRPLAHGELGSPIGGYTQKEILKVLSVE